MTSWLGLLLLGVVLVVFLRAVRRGTELFRVRIRDGEMELEWWLARSPSNEQGRRRQH